MISYTSFNNAVEHFDKTKLEQDKIAPALERYPYFNVMQVLEDKPSLLDFLRSETHAQGAMRMIYSLEPQHASLHYIYAASSRDQRMSAVESTTAHDSRHDISSPDTIVEDPTETAAYDMPTTEAPHETLYKSDLLGGAAAADLEVNEEENAPTEYIPTAENEEDILVKSAPKTDATDVTIHINTDVPIDENTAINEPVAQDRQVVQTFTFSSWLRMMKKKELELSEDREKVTQMKAEWQKQKLREILDEEDEVIDDEVFEMVISSVKESDELVSEPLAELYIKQGYLDKAKSVYHKLILKYPEKSGYFADQIRKIER